MVQELHAASAPSPEAGNARHLGGLLELPARTWKTHPAHLFLMELLTKKGAMTDADLLEALTEQFEDLGLKDFNELLMRLEVSGKIRTSSTVRGKRRIEPVA